MARVLAMTGVVAAAAMWMMGLGDGRLGIGLCRPVLRLVGRPVAVPSTPVHEEHGHWAGKQEE